jgi:epsilon-lactone hydrolase
VADAGAGLGALKMGTDGSRAVLSKEMKQVIEMLVAARSRVADRTFSAEEQRQRYRRFAEAMADPSGVKVDAVEADGVPCEWNYLDGTPEDWSGTGAVLFLHGGGYSIGGVDTHRKMVGHATRFLGLPILSVEYRLAPENPFPAGLSDAFTAYRWLIGSGIKASQIVVMGDSAGGGLALATCLEIRDSGLDSPGALVLLSPWADVTYSCDARTEQMIEDPLVSVKLLREMSDWYLNGEDPRDPRISPALGDLSAMPPTLIHIGAREVLMKSALSLEKALAQHNVEVDCRVWQEMVHVWHFFAGTAPEADAAWEDIAVWLAARGLAEHSEGNCFRYESERCV